MTSQTHHPGTAPGPVAAPPPAAPPSGSPSDRRLGRIVAASLVTGLLVGLLLVAAPFVPAQEDAVAGALLCGFAAGWAVLAVLSARCTTVPQRWAAAPAALMGLGGLVLIGSGPQVREVVGLIWPPALLATVAWVVVRARRELPGPVRRRLLHPVLAVLVLASIGGGYEAAAEAVDTATHPMPGRLIDVGGHGLHLNCTGSGSPTVVLEPGGGAMSSNLAWIAAGVGQGTRVCVYDRAGRGWSEPADAPQDGAQIAADLHTLLHRGGEPGPFVLAGHSFGGLYALTFAARYPDEVAGLVLVDSTAPAPPTATSGAGSSSDAMGRVSALASLAARLGLVRVLGLLSDDGLPPQAGDEVRAGTTTAADLRSAIDEYVRAAASTQQAAALRDLAGKPLVVLTAGAGHDATWTAKQDHLATLSTDSVHRVVDGATHESIVSDRGHAATTAQAILQVVAAVRGAGPVAG